MVVLQTVQYYTGLGAVKILRGDLIEWDFNREVRRLLSTVIKIMVGSTIGFMLGFRIHQLPRSGGNNDRPRELWPLRLKFTPPNPCATPLGGKTLTKHGQYGGLAWL